MSDVIVLACIAVAVIIGIVALLDGLLRICKRVPAMFRRPDDISQEIHCCSDYDPTFKPTKFNGQKDLPNG